MTQLALHSPVQCYMSLFHPVTLQSDQAVHSLTSQSTENPKMAVHCENFQSGLIQSIAYTRQRASSATWEENILSPHLRTMSEKFGLLRNGIMWSWSIPKFWQEGNPPPPPTPSVRQSRQHRGPERATWGSRCLTPSGRCLLGCGSCVRQNSFLGPCSNIKPNYPTQHYLYFASRVRNNFLLFLFYSDNT